METLSLAAWTQYRDLLASISQAAADEFRDAVWNIHGYFKGVGLGKIPRDDLINYAYALVTKYSEGATEAACLFYDAMAALSGANVPAAIPAETADIGTVAKTINGVLKQTENEEVISGSLGRLVKQAGQDTTLQNAQRDGAQVAWIPAGDTCAFCIALAARGWEEASANMVNNHAEHIHANCDCAYGVRFNRFIDYEGYNPVDYYEMYEAADGTDSKDKINAMRREFYAENSEKINEQKRDAYEKRKERESSEAEEINVE